MDILAAGLGRADVHQGDEPLRRCRIAERYDRPHCFSALCAGGSARDVPGCVSRHVFIALSLKSHSHAVWRSELLDLSPARGPAVTLQTAGNTRLRPIAVLANVGWLFGVAGACQPRLVRMFRTTGAACHTQMAGAKTGSGMKMGQLRRSG